MIVWEFVYVIVTIQQIIGYWAPEILHRQICTNNKKNWIEHVCKIGKNKNIYNL